MALMGNSSGGNQQQTTQHQRMSIIVAATRKVVRASIGTMRMRTLRDSVHMRVAARIAHRGRRACARDCASRSPRTADARSALPRSRLFCCHPRVHALSPRA